MVIYNEFRLGGIKMSTREIICQAIQERRHLKFNYKNLTRIVEPHQLALNEQNEEVLSAYLVGGDSKSRDKAAGTGEFFPEDISLITMLNDHFPGPRPDYKRTPNKKFHSAICEL